MIGALFLFLFFQQVPMMISYVSAELQSQIDT